MDYVGLILSMTDTGLKLWKHKDALKYKVQLAELRKERYEELNKPDGQMDAARIDRIEFRINILCNSFASEVGLQNDMAQKEQ